MLAVKSVDLRNNFKALCDKVFSGETLIVSRPKNENVVMLSENEYNELQKAKRNAEYLRTIDEGMEQIASGNGIYHDIIEVNSNE
jgi:antitoxin YefM